MYRIGEFSKLMKLTVKTIRFYNEVGLLKPSYIDEMTGYRYYKPEQFSELQTIVQLKQAGFSISEIKDVLSGKDIQKLFIKIENNLKEQRKGIDQKLLKLSSIEKLYKENKTMNFQATIKHLPEYTVYYKEFVAKHYSDYGNIVPQIGESVRRANPTLKCLDPDFCYVENLDNEFKEKDVHAVYVQAVERTGVEVEGIKFKKIPPIMVASIVLKGSYRGITDAYIYLVEWIEKNGYKFNGNSREQYIDGPWNKTNEADYMTEVQIPICKK